MKKGLCDKCGRPAEAAYEIRDNSVYLVKFCRTCGRTSTMVTRDAKKWQWKRDLSEYQEPCRSQCSMDCAACDHQAVTPPNTVAIDVTNLCNQRCPICLAYCDAMGYAYHPPIEYFDKIFRHFLNNDPKPNICFFGGEPTVHKEFLEIVSLARSYDYKVQLFTNGLKLADKEYCRKLCSMGIQVNFGFDGTEPDIYRTLRGDNSLAAKRRAFDNVIECGVNKLAVITTVAGGVNDRNMDAMLRFIHEYRRHVSVWALVPLTPCWDTGSTELQPTTTECVERIFEDLVAGNEFVPTGMMKFKVLSRFFGRQTLGGSHPNCESATLLVSDGEAYRPISEYLNVQLSTLLSRLKKLDEELASKEATLPARGLRRLRFDVEVFMRMVGTLGRCLNPGRLFGRSTVANALLSVTDLLRGKKLDRILSERTSFKQVLTMITIPYEDKGGLEDARLHDCPAVFAYEDVDTGKIRTTAFCSWQIVKDDVCRKIQAHYAGEAVALPENEPLPKIASER
ncbi:MAG: radical SAM protein [Pseudomonadota bacterium]